VLAATPADEPGLDIGQAGIIGPAIRADPDGMAAPVIGAIDQDTANAYLAHSPKVIFCGQEGIRLEARPLR
jgi:hypothetical protein